MLKHRSLINICRALLFAATCFVAFFVWTSPPKSWQVDTNLRSLSPDFVRDKGVQNALDTLSSSIAQKFFILLIADDPDDVEEAADLLLDMLSADAGFAVSDPANGIDSYLELIKRYRFHLMTGEQARWLANASLAQLRQYTQSRFYSLEGSAQALSLSEDPFGFASNFIAAAADRGFSSDEAIGFDSGSGKKYALPLAFEIKNDALSMTTQKDVMDELDSTKAQLLEELPRLQFLHSGVVFFAADAAQKSKRDISFIGLGSSIGITLLVLLVFRSLSALLLPLCSVAFGVGLAFSSIHYLNGSIHILTIVFGASLIGVAIDYALHYFYHQSSEHSVDSRQNLHRALFFSLLTSLIGYAALSLSGLESLRDVAVFSVLGLFGAWLLVIALGPVLTKNLARKRSVLQKFVEKILSCSKKLSLKSFCMVCFVILGTFASMFLWGIKSSDDPRVFFTPNPALLAQEKQVSELISSYEPGTFVVISAQSNRALLQKFDSLNAAIGEASAGELFGLHRFVPSLQAQKRAYDLNRTLFGVDGEGITILKDLGLSPQAIKRLQDSLNQQQHNQFLQPQALAASLGESARNFWFSDGEQHYSFLLIPRGFNNQKLVQLAAQDSDIHFINSAELASQAIRQQRESASLLVLCALGLVALLIILRHRKLKYLALILVPASAMATALILLQLFSVPITLFHIMALFLVLGLGMDYVIFVSEISDAKILTLEAVLLSTITSLLSFGLLSLSAIPVVKAFGLTVLIGNSVNFLGACCLVHLLNAPRNSPAKI